MPMMSYLLHQHTYLGNQAAKTREPALFVVFSVCRETLLSPATTVLELLRKKLLRARLLANSTVMSNTPKPQPTRDCRQGASC